MKAYRGVDVSSHVFLSSALVGGVVSFTPGERALGVDDVKK
jgi:hypothetical protein